LDKGRRRGSVTEKNYVKSPLKNIKKLQPSVTALAQDKKICRRKRGDGSQATKEIK